MKGSSGSKRALRRTVAVALVLILGVSDAAGAAEPTERALQRKLRFYMQTGVFGGEESRALLGYNKTPMRIFIEMGLNRLMSEPGQGGLESIALGASMAIGVGGGGRSDVRFAVGPGGAWRLGESWTLNAMVGPLRSNQGDKFGLGVQARLFACYRNKISLDYLSQELPARGRYGHNPGPWETSQYFGVAVHGNLGIAVSLALLAVAAIATIVLLIALVSGPGWSAWQI